MGLGPDVVLLSLYILDSAGCNTLACDRCGPGSIPGIDMRQDSGCLFKVGWCPSGPLVSSIRQEHKTQQCAFENNFVFKQGYSGV